MGEVRLFQHPLCYIAVLSCPPIAHSAETSSVNSLLSGFPSIALVDVHLLVYGTGEQCGNGEK